MTASHSVVPVEQLLDLHAYDGECEKPDKFVERGEHLDIAVSTVSLKVREHLDTAVSTVSLKAPGDTSLAAAEGFLGKLLWETETMYPGTQVLRWVTCTWMS